MCKSDNEPQKADLTTRFDDIKFTVNDSDVIVCNENRWMYQNIGNEGISRSIRKKESEEENNLQNNSKIDSLKEEIDTRKSRIEELKKKINEIDNKIETMNKILNIDVSEQEYVKELSDKINNEKSQE